MGASPGTKNTQLRYLLAYSCGKSGSASFFVLPVQATPDQKQAKSWEMEQKKGRFLNKLSLTALSAAAKGSRPSHWRKQGGRTLGSPLVCLSPGEPLQQWGGGWHGGRGSPPPCKAMCHLLRAPQHPRGQGTPLSPLTPAPLLKAAKFSFVHAAGEPRSDPAAL